MSHFEGVSGALNSFALKKRMLLMEFHQDLRSYLQEHLQTFYDKYPGEIRHIDISIVSGEDPEVGEYEGIDVHCCTDNDAIRDEFVDGFRLAVLDHHMNMVFSALSEPISVGEYTHADHAEFEDEEDDDSIDS